MRSGNQNWVSVSRAIKPFAEPNRPPDWFSQKHCASQYSELLETVETPKRKRNNERGEVDTAEDLIVRKLTLERVEELKRQIEDNQQQYRKLKIEAERIRRGELDPILKSTWEEIKKSNAPPDVHVEEPKRQAIAVTQSKAPASATGKTPVRPVIQAKKKAPQVSIFQPKHVSQQAESGTEDKTESDSEAETPVEVQTTLTDFEVVEKTVVKEVKFNYLSTTNPTSALPSILTSQLTTRRPSIVHDGLTSLYKECSPHKELSTTTTTTTTTNIPTTPSPQPAPEATIPTSPAIDAPTLSKLLNSAKTILHSSVPKTTGSIVHVGGGDTTAASLPTPLSETAAPKDIPSIEIQDDTSQDNVKQEESVSDIEQQEVNEVNDKQSDNEVAKLGEKKIEKESEKNLQITIKEEPSTEETKGGGNLSVDDEEPASPTSSTSSARPDTDPKSARKKGAKTRTLGSRKSARVRNREKQDDDGEGENVDKTTRKDETSEAGSVDGRKDDERSEAEEWLAADSGDDGSSSKPLPHLPFYTDSIPASPASLSQSSDDPEAIQAQKAWKKSIMMVWRSAASHKYANVFLHPVTDDLAPGYHSIVNRPMDLSTIKKNLETGQLRTTSEFQRDIMLMFQNAVMYNNSDHDVYKMAIEMQRDVMEHIQVFLTTQLMVQQSEAKMLRIRDTPRRSDSSEKDEEQSRRRKLSAEASDTSGKKRRTRADE
ncbi:bromodomain-containing protein 8-like [Glandiceps talaboti]